MVSCFLYVFYTLMFHIIKLKILEKKQQNTKCKTSKALWERDGSAPQNPLKKPKQSKKNNSIWCWCHHWFFQVNLIETILNQKLLLNSCEITEVIYLHCFYNNLWMDLCICYSYHKYYSKSLIVCSLLSQVAVFMYYGCQMDRLVLQVSSPSFLKSPLPYHPQLRAQAWRYLSYIFMHTGWV